MNSMAVGKQTITGLPDLVESALGRNTIRQPTHSSRPLLPALMPAIRIFPLFRSESTAAIRLARFDNNWTKTVLADGFGDGFVPGFISDHSYMQGPGSESDSFLLNDTVSNAASTLDWSTRYADYEAMLQQTRGRKCLQRESHGHRVQLELWR